MKREIKFKAWAIREKRMYIPFDLYDILMEEGSHNPQEDWLFLQWTGLKDKYYKDIYEGDIVQQRALRLPEESYCDEEIDYTYIGEVRIIPSKGVCLSHPIVIDNLEENRKFKCDYNKNVVQYRCEIIGNIYENKELI